MADKIEIKYDKKPTIKGGTFYVTINDKKTSKKYRWCIWRIHYKNENGKTRKIPSLFIGRIIEKQLVNFGSFGKDGGTFIIKIYDIEKVKEKKNSELSNFSEEASLEIEIKKEEEKTTRHNITPEIEKVYLSKKGSGNISKVSYQDTLIATAKTKGLEGKKITFNLYERDEKDKTHVKDFFAEVDRYGIASVEIPLLSNKKVFQLLANQKAPEYGEGNKHEFFVMASFGLNKTIKESNELQVNLTKKIKKAYFVDVNGKKVNKIQVGDSVYVRIESEDMIGTLVRYTILEKDVINDDVIWVRKLIINDDIHTDGKITITENLFNEGANLGYVDPDSEKQNYYIKVEALVGKKESSAFELSFESVEFEVGKSPVKVEVGEVKKEEKKEEPLEEGACPHCRKKHIDLQGDKKKFEFQGKGNKNCNLTCVKIIKKFEIIPEGAEYTSKYPNKGNGYECYYQLADENEERTKLIFRDSLIRGGKKIEVKEAYKYLDDALEHGHPIMVGVDHTLNRTFKETTIENGIKKVKNIYINDTTTDHYVVIIGRDCDKGKVRYIFWDVGSDDGGKEWYFEKQEDGSLIAPKAHNSKTYTVTQIRRNRRKITEEIINKKTNEKTKKTKKEIITY